MMVIMVKLFKDISINIKIFFFGRVYYYFFLIWF